ncbi:prepilin-type N-terminal cleavage/methylation domain-containing protein [Clostridium perfringens]|nr:prepilin-type N-terminal cleavage/methylation domain-containing protein [Clostridium perfringens]
MNTKKQNKKKKGFTLIELIIVIAIIAILAAIAIPNFLSIQRKAKVKADIASAKTIYDATSALIAEGQIIAPATGSDITLTLNADGAITGGGSTGTSSQNNGTDAQDLQNYLQTVPVPQSVDKGTFKVTIKGPESNPVIQVDINDTQVYPKADSEYALNK